MGDQAEERRSVLTPVRLVVGSLIAGVGLALLGFFWGAGSATAAEPPQPGPLAQQVFGSAGSLITGADTAVSSTVGLVSETAAPAAAAFAAPVAAAVPEPVRHAVAAAPVTDAAKVVAASAPVEQAVAPAVTAVDDLAATIPLADNLFGANPADAVVTPLAGLVDHTVGALAGLTALAVIPIAGRQALDDGTATAGGFAWGGLTSVPAGGSSGGASGEPALSSDGFGGSSALVAGWSAPGMPPVPGGSVPSGAPAALSGSADSSGAGPAGPATVMPADLFALSTAASGRQGHAIDDRLPASPVAAHDTSPD